MVTMKKLTFVIILIVVIALLGVSFAGCNRATPTQNKLSNYIPWTNDVTNETLVYDVIYKSNTPEQVKGVYSVNVKSFNKENVTIGDWTSENAVGFKVTAKLEMENGDSIATEVFFTTNIIVKYASQTTVTAGVTDSYTAEYKDEKCYFTRNENGVETSGEIKTGDFYESPYFDNAMLYQLVRCMPSGNSSFTFNIPDITLSETQSVTITSMPSSTTTITAADSNAYECYLATIKLNRTFPGSGEGLKCYISSKSYPSDEDAKVNKLIVQIVEGDTVYTLKSVSY